MLPEFPSLKAELLKVVLAKLRQLVDTGDPILSQIKRFRQHEGSQMRYLQQDGSPVQEGFERIGGEFTVTPQEVPTLVGQNLEAKLVQMAELIVAQSAKTFFKKMGEISEKAGTSINAGGKPVSPEMFLDMMDRVQMEFDPDGMPAQSLVVHPDTVPAVEKVSRQIENDPELKRRHSEILERQRKAWTAREDNRKLVD